MPLLLAAILIRAVLMHGPQAIDKMQPFTLMERREMICTLWNKMKVKSSCPNIVGFFRPEFIDLVLENRNTSALIE